MSRDVAARRRTGRQLRRPGVPGNPIDPILERSGLTQKELADAIGFRFDHISRIKHGRYFKAGASTATRALLYLLAQHTFLIQELRDRPER